MSDIFAGFQGTAPRNAVLRETEMLLKSQEIPSSRKVWKTPGFLHEKRISCYQKRKQVNLMLMFKGTEVWKDWGTRRA